MIIRVYLGRFARRVSCPECGRVDKGTRIFATGPRIFTWFAYDEAVRHSITVHGIVPAVELVNDPSFEAFALDAGYPQPTRRRDDEALARMFTGRAL